jgi:TonB-linked SusC/RagA family outer membrane protein
MNTLTKISIILWFSFFFLFANGQQTISGIVKDNGDNLPLIGVAIQVKGFENIGTFTAVDGSYNIEIPQEAEKLIFSYTGYQGREIPIVECNNKEVTLTVSATFLDEVLVVGFGTISRSDISGSIAKVKREDIEGIPVNSLESTLQGQVAGVFISNNTSKLGQNIDVRIRGTASINASLEPLYVMDGMVINSGDQISLGHPRLNPLADINFNDIESIEILKDASAAAIYGSRASNGVILITTKKGVVNDTRINLDMNVGWSGPTRKRKWLNAAQYLELWDEAFANVANSEGLLFGQSGDQWKDNEIPGWRDGYDTNWEDLMYNADAGQRQLQLSMAGGNDKTTFYLSGGYSDQTSIIILNSFERISGRLNLTHQANPKLNFGMNMSLARTFQNVTPTDPSFASPAGTISQSPAQPLYDPENPSELFTETLYLHGLFYQDNADVTNVNLRTIGNAFLNWRPVENLTLHTDFGLDLLNSHGEDFYNSKLEENTGEENGLKRTNVVQNLNYSINNYANYKIKDQQHNADLTAGMTYQELNESHLYAAGRNFPNDDFQNLSSAGEIFDGGEVESAFSVLSWFARVNYNYDQRYLVSLSSRIDGDSRFGKDNRYGFFPAASAGWVISKESFFQSKKLLSYLKLRGSWGLTGNTPLTHFPALGLFEGTRYAGGSGIVQTQIPNPNLKWEKTKQIDVGVDFGLLDDRISGQLDYYVKNTQDLLLQVNIPATTGFPTQLQNIGSMQNKGIEFQLNTYNLTGAFKWKTTLNFSKNKNTVTNIQGQVIEGGVSWLNVSRAMEGQPIGVFFIPEYAGVDPNNGDALYYLNKTLSDGKLDRNTTNNISEAQRVVVGDPNPDFIYGISNTFSWKGFDLEVFFQGVQGNEIIDASGRFYQDGFGWFDNQDIRMLGRWQQPGDQTEIPQLRFLEGTFYSSRFIEDGSYLRLKNISLSYDLPTHLVEKMGFRKLKIYGTGQNLWTRTNYQGRDPEVNTDTNDFLSSGSIVSGVDFFTPPQARTIVFGIKAEF